MRNVTKEGKGRPAQKRASFSLNFINTLLDRRSTSSLSPASLSPTILIIPLRSSNSGEVIDGMGLFTGCSAIDKEGDLLRGVIGAVFLSESFASCSCF